MEVVGPNLDQKEKTRQRNERKVCVEILSIISCCNITYKTLKTPLGCRSFEMPHAFVSIYHLPLFNSQWLQRNRRPAKTERGTSCRAMHSFLSSLMPHTSKQSAHIYLSYLSLSSLLFRFLILQPFHPCFLFLLPFVPFYRSSLMTSLHICFSFPSSLHPSLCFLTG